MKVFHSKFLSESAFRLEVAAHASLRHRNVVSRGIPTVQASDKPPQERLLKPRTAQKPPVLPRREEEPPSLAQFDVRHEDGVRRKNGPGQHEVVEGSRGDRYGEDDVPRDRIPYRKREGRGAQTSEDERSRRRREVGQERPSSHRRSTAYSKSNQTQSENQSGPLQQQQLLPVPIDRKMARSPRYLAVQQLIRVEEEGAYVGLVNGSPTTAAPRRSRSNARTNNSDNGGDGGNGDETDMFGEDDGGAGRWRREGGGSGRSSREPPLDPRDQRLVKELVAGVTRLRRRLDYIVSNLTEQTPADLESGVRQVLRLGVFELTERNLVPYALNEHVQLMKALSGHGAASFVNGVLRSAARQLEAGTLATPESRAAAEATGSGGGSGGIKAEGSREALRQLALKHSHPNWMVSRWLERFGREGAEALLRRNNQPPVYTVRVNTLRPGASAAGLLEQLEAVGVQAEPSPLLPEEFIRIRSGLQKLLAEGFVSDGSLIVQDESAGLVVSLLDPQPGDRLLDCCAAPGGKTLFAAARMRGRGSITALDISAARLGALRRSAELVGVSDMVTTHACDLRKWVQQATDRAAWLAEMRPSPEMESAEAGPVPQWQRFGRDEPKWERDRVDSWDKAWQPSTTSLYDKVLLDTPCTGTGVLAKRADLRWRRTPEQLRQLVDLQDELMDAAASMVAPGGILVYSTCSIEEEEDSQRVMAFLARHHDFKLEAATSPADNNQIQNYHHQGGGDRRSWVPASVITAKGFVATLPHIHDTDGAFAARLRRR